MVCIGNVCRSPLAERLLAERLPADRFEVSSAGVRAMVDCSVDPRAAAELTRLGGSADGFLARQLTRELVDEADLVLTATADVRRWVLALVPESAPRVFTLGEYAGTGGDIPDPMGRSRRAHRLAADRIDAATRAIAERLRA